MAEQNKQAVEAAADEQTANATADAPTDAVAGALERLAQQTAEPVQRPADAATDQDEPEPFEAAAAAEPAETSATEDDADTDGDSDDAGDDEYDDDYREEKVVVVRRGVFYAVAAAAILVIAALAGLNVYQATKSSDPAVAVVNGTKIPRSQYDKIIARSDNGSGQTEAQAVVDQLINTTLLEQDAAKHGVTASPDEIDAELKKQKANFSSDADYQTALAQAHLTEPELRDQLKDQVLLQKLVLNNVTVSDDEVTQEYNQNKDTTYQGKTLDQVKDQIKADLLQQKQQTAEQTYFDNLQAKAKITRHIPGA